ncbi:MAG: hypothetical protein Q9164_000236 [Protoblastenia rupestris]
MAHLHGTTVEKNDPYNDEIRQLLQTAEHRLRAVGPSNGDAASGKLALSPSANGLIVAEIATLKVGSLDQPYITSTNGVARTDPRRFLSDSDRKLISKFRGKGDLVSMKERKISKEKARAGDQWFNLPRTDLTPELERDLQLLRMRSVLDPKRHYKKDNANGQAPEFSQVGTLIEGPTEYFSARIPYTERKRNLLEEVLAGEASTGRFKSKYNNVQAAKSSGRRKFYKKLKEKRSRSFRNSRSSE